MAHTVPARLSGPYTAAAGRKFGLTVGLALIALSLVARWRGHPISFAALGAIGAALVVAGLIIPTLLRRVEAAWMKLAEVLSKVTTPLFMGLVYFVVLTPIGALRRLLGGSALVHPSTANGYWFDRSQSSRSSLERLF